MSWRRNEQQAGRSLAARNLAMSAQAASLQPPPPTSTIGRSAAASEPAQFGEVGGAGMGAHRAVGADRRDRGGVAQHVLGQRDDDRAGAAGGRDLERLVEQLGDALGHVDLRHPFGERRVHLAEIDLLEGLAVDLVARHLADQHDHRRRILERGVDADRGVAGAGAARHQQHAGLAGQLAVGLGHERGAALLAAGDEVDLGRVEERVEHLEIALAGDAERHLDAMRLEAARRPAGRRSKPEDSPPSPARRVCRCSRRHLRRCAGATKEACRRPAHGSPAERAIC